MSDQTNKKGRKACWSRITDYILTEVLNPRFFSFNGYRSSELRAVWGERRDKIETKEGALASRKGKGDKQNMKGKD